MCFQKLPKLVISRIFILKIRSKLRHKLCLIQVGDKSENTLFMKTVLEVNKCRLGHQGRFEIVQDPTDSTSRYFSLKKIEPLCFKTSKTTDNKSRSKRTSVKKMDDDDFIDDESIDEYESDDSAERSRPKTRQTEVKKLRKENKEQGNQLKDKDAEIRKLREKLEAAEINMSSVNKD